MPDNPKPGIAARVAQAAQYVILNITPSTWMSPDQPLAPMAPADVKGRQFDYQVGSNLNYIPRAREPVGFPKLRTLAENCNVLRTVIERQKDLIEAFEWAIKPREEQPGKRPAETKFTASITEITAFLQSPDNALDWGQWLRAVLEDLFVIDAVTLYRRPTLDGTRLWGLERIDGATITTMVDAGGRRPQPPSPAYQQILKGIPTADFTKDELIYYPKNPRTNRLYGCSPVQQIVTIAEAQIYRTASQKAYFDTGNLTDGMFTGPKEWSTDQLKAWQVWWDDHFSGNIEARRHGIWVPADTKFESIKQPPLKDEFDEWLARVICFAFSTSPLPFVKAMNRGNQDSQQEVAEDGGIATYMQFIKRLMDLIIREDLGHPELEFCWNTDKEFDPLIAAQIDDYRLRNGSKTLNEVRDRNGDDPYEADIGDKPLIVTAQGAVSIEQALAPPPEPVAVPGGAEGGGGAPLKSGGGGGAPPAPKPAPAAPLKKAVRHALPYDSAKLEKARAKMSKVVRTDFIAIAKDVGAQAHRQALILGKADEDETDEERTAREAALIAGSLDLSGLTKISDGVEGIMGATAEDAGQLTLLQVGLGQNDKLTGQVAVRAMNFARDRAAELVGKRWTPEGELIDNPDAKWAIDESTRTMLRGTIEEALADNVSVDDLSDRIRASYAFSEKRASLIAETEVARANVQGALEGAREARDAGVVLQKVWLLGQEPCDICLDNAEQGPIELDDDFQSGDDGPPAHPNACFEGTAFAPYGSVTQMLRSRYDGPAVTIKAEFFQEGAQAALRNIGALANLDNGDISSKKFADEDDLLLRGRPITGDDVAITIGPNHPMLSRRGWIKASEIREGDHLLYDAGPVGAFGDAVPESHLQEVMFFEDAFETILAASDTALVSSPGDYFHGDEVFCYGEIEAVRPTRDLLPKLDVGSLQNLSECLLTRSYPDAEHVATCGSCRSRLDGIFGATDSSMGGRDDLSALIGGEGRPPGLHAVRVVSSHLGTFHGWAFDASTEHTIYRAGGFVVKNCYCSLSWEVAEDDDAEKLAKRRVFECEAC